MIFLISSILSNQSTRKLNSFAGKFFNKPVPWIEKLKFYHILIIWLFLVILFGLIYFVFSDENNYLYYNAKGRVVQGVFEPIYFSFITATSTGFGDIIPFGFFRILSIIEVVFGLILLAVVTSKLVSIRQDLILTELYEISFNERLNRVRSSLLLFRQNINRLISRIEEDSFKDKDLAEFLIYVNSFEDYLIEVLGLFQQSRDSKLSIAKDSMSSELIFNSVINSFQKLLEIVELVSKKKKLSQQLKKTIYKCISIGETVCEEFAKTEAVSQEKIAEFLETKQKLHLILDK